jgi:hypothetical protein
VAIQSVVDMLFNGKITCPKCQWAGLQQFFEGHFCMPAVIFQPPASEVGQPGIPTNVETDSNPKERDSSHKVPVHLFPPAAIVAGAHVIAQGHKKPGRSIYNWRQKPIRFTDYYAAITRHLMKSLDGEETDAELTELAGSPISHIDAALASLAIMIDARESGTLIDDRPKSNGATAKLLERLTDANLKHKK